MASNINPNIANGTCYYAENTVTKGDFIPCGNELIQAWPCCHAGSFCLALRDANACWDAKSGNTYVAGCTDPSFGSPHCLHKPPPFHDQEWVAINQACTNLNSNSAVDNITNWTGCTAPDNSTDLVKLPMASCTPFCEPAHVLYAGISSLPAFASLPTLSGSSIFWQNDFVPPTAPVPGYTPGTPTGVVPNRPGPGGSGLSTGAKAGIGVGAGIGGIILIAMLVTSIIWCHRHRKRRQSGLPPAGQPYNQPYPPEYPASGHLSPPPNPYNTAYNSGYHHGQPQIAEFGTPNTPVFAGYKTELPADEQPNTPPSGKHPSPGQQYVEMDTGEANPVPVQYLQPHPSPGSPGHQNLLPPGQGHGGGGSAPGSPPLSATSTMLSSGQRPNLTPSPQGSPPQGYEHPATGLGQGPVVWHSRSTSSPSQSYSSRVAAAGGGLGPGVYHSRSVSSSGVSPGYEGTGTTGTGADEGWEAGSYR